VTGALGWARQWGISVASFVGGLLALFVFRRELPHATWIVGYLLVLWLVVAATVQVRDVLAARPGRRPRLVLTAADYTIQTLYHGILLFLLPAYWASTTLTSSNVVFLALLGALVLVATVDPWYRALVHPRPCLQWTFFFVAVFAALNAALPLLGVQPYPALILAGWLAGTALTPVVRRTARWPWAPAFAVTASVSLAVGLVLSQARALVPPVPLSLARAAVARDVADFEPVGPVVGPITAAEVQERGLVAYTAVHAPAGLKQRIVHVWRHEGRPVDVVPLAPVRGGRREGFRTFSRKATFPPDAAGRWTVDVVTGSGQLIGRLRFRVTP
jgi:hypothetical protein